MKFPSALMFCPVGHKTQTATFRKLKGIVPLIFCLTLLVPISDNGFTQEPKTREEKPQAKEEEQQPADEKAQPKEEKPQTTVDEKPQPKEEEQPREEKPKAREEKPRPREDKPLPKDDFEARAKRDYDRIENPEVTFAHYLELRKQEALRQNQLKKSPQLAYTPVIGQKTPCGNGDFEAGLNPAEWQGAYGLVPANGNPILSSFTNGIVSGAINLGTSRQTVVGPSGTDPNVGIPLTAPGSTRAVRIGNAVTGAGSELLSKTFTVTAANSLISFWYAVVFQDPGHSLSSQPSFWVRVTVNGNYVPGLVNLGNNSDKVVADGSNVFFQKTTTGLLYKNWTCAQIDLSQQIGKTVTIEFVTEDCTQGGHYGYAYLDNFCGSCAGSPTGSLTFAPSTSSTCGPGQLCFNYSLPKNPTTGATGSVKITLGLFQSGALLTSFASPTLTSGTSYCFPITPLSLPGINAGAGYFDFMATGVFALAGTPPSSMAVGTAPGGQPPGINDDYKIVCGPGTPTASKWCCPGANLVTNGDFESPPVGNTKPPVWPGITSQYAASTSTAVGATLPGQYNVVTGAQASGISAQWSALDHTTCNAASGHFMVINGKTTQTTGSKTIWKQTVAVTGGKEYRFCAYVKNLPQCTFDIRPQIEVKFSDPGNTPIANIASTVVNMPGGQPCRWQLIATSFVAPIGVTSLTIDILLDEQGLGDGNDLALDDISLQEKPLVPVGYVLIDITAHQIGNGKYTIRADYPPNLPQTPNCGYVWGVCELDANDNCKPNNSVSNPSAWWTFPTTLYNDFNGYNGTNSTLNGPSPGVFIIGKRYRITFAASCDCEGLRQSSWLLQYNAALKKPQATQIEVHD